VYSRLNRDITLPKSFDLGRKELYANRIREKQTQYLEKTRAAREQYKREKAQEILEIIKMYYHSKGGILHNNLANTVNLDRKSLRVYTKILLKEGSIKREGKGYHGKYVPTQKPSYTELLLKSSLFADDFKFNLLNTAGIPKFSVLYEYNGYGGPSLIFDKPPNNIDPVDGTLVDFTSYAKYYDPKFTEENSLERMLFESSNRIGAFIIYAIIQAMSLANNEMLSLSNRERNQFIADWTKTCILQIIPHLILFFRESAHKSMSSFPRVEDPKVKYIKEIQISELNKSFERIYPYLSYKLRKSIDKLPQSLQSYKKWEKSLTNEIEMQENCKHQFKKAFGTKYGYYNRQCLKCHYIEKGKMPRSERSQKK
jgi:predicted transcriptional regulator